VGFRVGFNDDGFIEAGVAEGFIDDGFQVVVGFVDDGFVVAGTAVGDTEGDFDGVGAVDLAATGCAVGGLETSN